MQTDLQMKKLLMTFLISAFVIPVFAQTAATAKKIEDYIKFKELKHNFGKIKQGVPVTYDFAFTNVGNEVLIIENATASCGCTTPQWPKTPIAKGKSDKITAGFNAAAAGPFSKEIYVKVKGVDYPMPISITGEVLSTDDFAKLEAEKKKGKGKK
jgi:Protein of unknown function (DUF1573)